MSLNCPRQGQRESCRKFLVSMYCDASRSSRIILKTELLCSFLQAFSAVGGPPIHGPLSLPAFLYQYQKEEEEEERRERRKKERIVAQNLENLSRICPTSWRTKEPVCDQKQSPPHEIHVY